MKYFVLLASDGEMTSWGLLTPEEQQASMEMHMAFSAACEDRAAVQLLGGEALAESSLSTTLRTRDGEMTVTDGPFAEATEHVGGYYVIDAPDLDTVIELCQVLPAYDIEIRPVLDLG